MGTSDGNYSISGRWYGYFSTEASRGLGLLIQAAAGKMTGHGWMGAVADKPNGGTVVGTIGPDNAVSLDLQMQGPSKTTHASFPPGER